MAKLESKQKLIEKYRDINVDHEYWYEWVIEKFKGDMQEVGIWVDRVYFSGFWSQGDGACFEGNAIFPKFMLNFKPDEYPMIRKLLANHGSLYFSVKQRGHYNHENCTEFSIEADQFNDVLDTKSHVQEKVVEVYDEQLSIELGGFEDEATEFFKDKMREVYRALEKAYENETSDEAVWDSIVANELDTQLTDEE